MHADDLGLLIRMTWEGVITDGGGRVSGQGRVWAGSPRQEQPLSPGHANPGSSAGATDTTGSSSAPPAAGRLRATHRATHPGFHAATTGKRGSLYSLNLLVFP